MQERGRGETQRGHTMTTEHRVVGRRLHCTYVAVGGHSVVALNSVCLTAGNDDRAGNLGFRAVGDRSTFRRGLKQKTEHE